MEQARGAVGHVLDEHLAAAVQQQAVQRRLVRVLCDGRASLLGPAGAGGEDVDGVPCRVLEQEPEDEALARRLEIADIGGVCAPPTGLGQGALVRLCDGDVVQPVERHSRCAGPAESCSRSRSAAASGADAAESGRPRCRRGQRERRALDGGPCEGVNELLRNPGTSRESSGHAAPGHWRSVDGKADGGLRQVVDASAAAHLARLQQKGLLRAGGREQLHG